ncbi:MAG: M15 family metallopeptidase [Bacteroidales bacterium]|nr:M15 family metallopeptidase [Bacteroidales bacterium]
MKRKFLVIIVFIISSATVLFAQKKNPYNLDIVNSVLYYEQLVKENPDNELIDLQKFIPNIKLDVRYATSHNFTGKPIYTHPRAFLRKPAAEKLLAVQKELNARGLGLVIWDAYRPYAGTLRFFEVCPDSTFCASPTTGSIHNRGCAVDLTVCDLNTGKYLDMGTDFDSFSDSAFRAFKGLTPTQLANRKMFEDVMVKHGFKPLSSEWWHYDLLENKKYPITDLSFEELEELEND